MVEQPGSLLTPGSCHISFELPAYILLLQDGRTFLSCLTHRSQVSFPRTETQPNILSNIKRGANKIVSPRNERKEDSKEIKFLMLSAACLWGLSREDTVLSSHGNDGNDDYSCYLGSHLNNRIYRTILNDCCLVRQPVVNTHSKCSFPKPDLSFPKIVELSQGES